MKERIEELARECGLIGYEFVNGKPVIEKISPREIRFFNEALELAARECDQTAKRSERDLHGSVRCAAAIRKLKV